MCQCVHNFEQPKLKFCKKRQFAYLAARRSEELTWDDEDGDTGAEKTGRHRGGNRRRLRVLEDELAEGGGDGVLTLVARAHVTPTRVALVPPEPEMANRVLRNWSRQSDRFLRITFTMSETLKFSSPGFGDLAPAVFERIKTLMKDGIIAGGRRYDFLAFSTSQLRECSAWMFSSDTELTAADVRRWMGDFQKINNAAKYAARMGQCFSR
jgi:hypothetical protein